jgi:ribosomal protein S18 acetylase RimI-like enzyme
MKPQCEMGALHARKVTVDAMDTAGTRKQIGDALDQVAARNSTTAGAAPFVHADRYVPRDASGCDVDELVRLLEELQRYVADLDPIGRVLCGEGFGVAALIALVEAVDDQDGRVLVLGTRTARLGGLCAGFVCRPQTALDRLDVVENRQGYLAKPFLEPEARGAGWGQRLVENLEGRMRARSCDNMWVDVNAYNPALEFYETNGFVAREIGLLKPLR